MTRAGIPILLLLVTAGCSHGGHDVATGDATAAGEAESALTEFDEVIHHDGVILFRSWNGHFIGTDCDTGLRFLPNHRAEMVEYGQKISTYEGTYEIDDKGRITTSFAGFGHSWPPMLIRRDGADLVLVPENGDSQFVMGNRGSTTLPSNAGTYWPFRHIAANGKVGFGD